MFFEYGVSFHEAINGWEHYIRYVVAAELDGSGGSVIGESANEMPGTFISNVVNVKFDGGDCGVGRENTGEMFSTFISNVVVTEVNVGDGGVGGKCTC